MQTKVKNISKKNITQIENTLRVGDHEKGGLNLHCRMYLDGEKVRDFKGDSFTMPFAYGLLYHMHRGPCESFFNKQSTSRNRGSSDIVSITNGSPAEVEIDTYEFDDVEDGDFAWIWGVQGMTQVNGMYRVRKRSDDRFVDLYELDNSTPLDTSTYSSYVGGGNISICKEGIQSVVSDGESPICSWDLVVGTDSTAVSIRDFGLHNGAGAGSAAGEFSETATQISTQTTNKPSSRFTVSRSFTNDTGSDINVSEIGISARRNGFFDNNDEDFRTFLLARDVLGSALNVPDTKTLTIEYEVVINLEPDTQSTSTDGTNGGFLDNFLSYLRSLAVGNSVDQEGKVFTVCSTPGYTVDNYRRDSLGKDRGIIVGTDNTYTSMTDSGALSKINHGTADGELYYYGSNVERTLEIDEVNDKAIITINRIFENRGSVDVIIGEVALRGNSDQHNDGFNSVPLARTALESADQYTVNPGDFVQVTYKIEIVA